MIRCSVAEALLHKNAAVVKAVVAHVLTSKAGTSDAVVHMWNTTTRARLGSFDIAAADHVDSVVTAQER